MMAAVAGEEREAVPIINSSICGHGVCKAQWTLGLDDRDHYALAVKKDTLMAGHLPRHLQASIRRGFGLRS